jgi:hypothetical protein
MIKRFSILALTLMSAVIVRSQDVIIVTPTIEPDLGNGLNPRSPILVPVLYIDGHMLTAASGTLGSTINILDEDGDVVFTTYVYIEGDITLPSTLSGTYTIEVIRGSQTFVGQITL